MKTILWKINFCKNAVNCEKVECDVRGNNDGTCQLYDSSTGVTHHNYSTEVLSRWYGRELRELLQKNLEWLNSEVIPDKLTELDKYINRAKTLSGLLKDQPTNVTEDLP